VPSSPPPSRPLPSEALSSVLSCEALSFVLAPLGPRLPPWSSAASGLRAGRAPDVVGPDRRLPSLLVTAADLPSRLAVAAGEVAGTVAGTRTTTTQDGSSLVGLLHVSGVARGEGVALSGVLAGCAGGAVRTAA
jgi:hypothetical protein